MPSSPPQPLPDAVPRPFSAEVRYSLLELLREVQVERSAVAFTMEKLDQVEITKLFEKRKKRRVLKSKP